VPGKHYRKNGDPQCRAQNGKCFQIFRPYPGTQQNLPFSLSEKKGGKPKIEKSLGKNKETIEAISPVLSACDGMERSGHERDGGICKGQNGPEAVRRGHTQQTAPLIIIETKWKLATTNRACGK
jgi:hypothetical protein